MVTKTFLVTGANGEIGHSLIESLRQTYLDAKIIAFDLADLDEKILAYRPTAIKGNILDSELIDNLFAENQFDCVFHLASLLSTKAEQIPEVAHNVNINGTVNILRAAAAQSEARGESVKVIFPSSIAVYGLPNLEEKHKAGKLKEWQYTSPITMYGCNKLYAESLGNYYTRNYKLTEDKSKDHTHLDFRCVRFPGLVSAITMPTGGTSDYGPEMLHYAAQNKHYDCFVRPDAALSFMAMPDAVKSLLSIAAAPAENLSQRVYNVTGFALTAEEFFGIVKKYFPHADLDWKPTPSRQRIVDSWPEDTNDDKARSDWGWSNDYDMDRAFEDYLVPAIQKRYNL